MPIVQVDPSGQVLTLTNARGPRRFHAVWLRDNAQDALTRSPGNGQRLIALRDIPPSTRIASARIDAAGALQVQFTPEGKTIAYDPDWLDAHAYDDSPPGERGWLSPEIETWDARLMQNVPCGDFA